MNLSAIEVCGLLARSLFFGRMFVQGVAAEKAKRPVAPPLFWKLSIAGAALDAVYAWNGPSHDVVISVAQIVSGALYVRLMRLTSGKARPVGTMMAAVFLLTTIAATAALLMVDKRVAAALSDRSPLWLVVGLVGQITWVSRFVLQWIAAERGRRETFSPGFLYTGLVGSSLSLAYAVHLDDWILCLGFVLVPLVYLRQIALMRRARALEGSGAPDREAKRSYPAAASAVPEIGRGARSPAVR